MYVLPVVYNIASHCEENKDLQSYTYKWGVEKELYIYEYAAGG